jgi:hypothetical protein
MRPHATSDVGARREVFLFLFLQLQHVPADLQHVPADLQHCLQLQHLPLPAVCSICLQLQHLPAVAASACNCSMCLQLRSIVLQFAASALLYLAYT